MFPMKYVMMGVGVLVVVGMLAMMTLEINRLRAVEENLTTQLAAETQRADNNAAALQRYAAAAANNAAVAEQVRDDRDALDSINRQLMEEIANAPDADDTALSPVMLRALDGLRHAFDAAACRSAVRDGGDADRAEDVSACNPPARNANGTSVSSVDDPGSDQRVGLPAGRGKARRLGLEQGADAPHGESAEDGAGQPDQKRGVVLGAGLRLRPDPLTMGGDEGFKHGVFAHVLGPRAFGDLPRQVAGH